MKHSNVCFALAAKDDRRHFGKAETVQSPARLEARFESSISCIPMVINTARF